MQLRATLLAITVFSVWAGDAAAQTCDPATFEPSCNSDGSIQVCDDETNAAAPVEDSLTCTAAFGIANDAVCVAAMGCTGDCADVGLGCEAPVGGNCVGFGVLTDQDRANNELAGSVLCSGDATCQLNADGTDTCVARVGPQCTPTAEATCVGNIVTLCLANEAGTFALTSNIAIDCSLFDTTCGDTPCECDEQCGDGGTCTNGICDTGKFCVFPSDVTCPTGEGEGEGEDDDNGGSDSRTRDEPEDAPAGCPFNASGAFPAFGALALLLASLRRRR
jgi:hypothetical protein